MACNQVHSAASLAAEGLNRSALGAVADKPSDVSSQIARLLGQLFETTRRFDMQGQPQLMLLLKQSLLLTQQLTLQTLLLKQQMQLPLPLKKHAMLLMQQPLLLKSLLLRSPH